MESVFDGSSFVDKTIFKMNELIGVATFLWPHSHIYSALVIFMAITFPAPIAFDQSAKWDCTQTAVVHCVFIPHRNGKKKLREYTYCVRPRISDEVQTNEWSVGNFT